ncbi:MAG: discoidin domain-containing protein [Cyclobacteriaceae bacterium]
MMHHFRTLFIFILPFLLHLQINAQTTNIGRGSYTTSFPGVDAAGRNGFPSGAPQLSGNTVGKPVPTNDWWSKLVKENHADNLFNYPMTLKTTDQGLIVTYIPWGVIGDSAPIEVGLSGLNVSKATVSDYSDWTVTMNWNDGSHELLATSGIGMPFIYFEKEADDIVEIKVNSGIVNIFNELLIIENASSGSDFVFYAPSGSSWSQSGSVYSSSLNGKNYWSMAMLPQETSNVNIVAQEYEKYAFVFPTNTTSNWAYDENSGRVRTDFTVDTEVKEGTASSMLLGLLPHQWANLAADSPQPDKYTYNGVRGEIKTLEGNSFSVENTYRGILPTMPYLANYSDGFSPSELDSKISQIENDGLATWTDSYNEGQVMNRLIQTARIADQTGDIEARNKMIATIKERFEDWLTYQSGEVAFLFYYNSDWSAMLGYPAGHGQDNNINDHHFHWGYFIHAAAFMEQFEPGWADEWGDMVNLLVRDAASSDRNDSQFPFLRNFSPYAGHCWANGFATFPQGNDQESTSESMQFNSSLIHWGTITGNDEIRDLGVYLYTTEQTAIEEYWFDMNERTFQSGQQYGLVSRVWGNSYDNGTFWTSDITASYGIELYPMHGGSLYLGQNIEYVEKIWEELKTYTGILSDSDTNPNLWHDTIWKYLSFIDPEKAIELYNSYPDRVLKFGISDVQTYHWIHAMNAMGRLKATVTADYPIAAAFEKNGSTTYVAHNYSNNQITVTFSDGYELQVPANKMATSKDAGVSGTITTDFNQAYPNGSVNLTVETSGNDVSKVEFYNGAILIGEDTSSPFEMKASNLELGVHGMFAKVYDGINFSVTNIVSIQVGEQVAYLGTPLSIPGIIEPGHYDKFEGGSGQGISYQDVSRGNEGDFRVEEDADAAVVTGEGVTIGWISAGEWLEYSIDVATAGNYDLSFRYASGNSNGGGPFHLEIDGNKISPDIELSYTGDWDTWVTKTVNNVEFNKGEQVLRLVFDQGEFNIGKMTFVFNSDLSYSPPVAEAGDNVVVVLPETTAVLDGTQSANPAGENLTYQWEQIYGPSVINFTDQTIEPPGISNLEEGIYKCRLTVSDGTYSSNDFVQIIVSETGNTDPVVSITSPSNNSSFTGGAEITITASASDLDGEITVVEFYDGETKIGEDNTEPYSLVWTGTSIGEHELTAKATDNDNAFGTSQMVNVTIQQVLSCTETSSESIQGSFTTGYSVNFETIGTDVVVTFELLDADKSSGNAYLWQESPFAESQMDFVETNIYRKTLSGLSSGTTIRYACKFEFTGGLAVTKYNSYVVGYNCEDVSVGASLSNLKVNGQTVSGFESNTLNYDVYLPVGTTIVPTITATANESGATVEVNEATSVPGTSTIVVTSEDDSSSITYSVTFEIESSDINLALNKTVVTSSDENSGTSGSNAVDGVQSTRWASSFSDPNWIYVDLGANYNLEQVVLIWEAAYARAYEVQISDDASNWSTIFSESAGNGGTDELSVSGNGRYVRINGTTRATPYGYSLFELEVYGTGIVVESSSDASLSSLKIDDTTISDFSTSTLSYNYHLPFGTPDVPTVTTTATDTNASVVVNEAPSLPGTTNIVVTAEDGTSTQTYTVEFTVEPGSNDASLSDIKVGGQTIDSFSASTLSYTISLPFGTIDVPAVTTTVTDTNASVAVNGAPSLPGITNIVVTAEDGTTTQTYTVEFTVEPGSNDASLSDIKVGGQTIDSFDASTLSYTISLPFGTIDVPAVTTTVTDTNASVVVNEAPSLPGITNIVVTAEDGTTTQTYTVEFTVEPGSNDANLSDIKVGGQTIDSFAASTLSYTISLPFATIDVPTVTATIKDANASAVINEVASLPGTTNIIVTAEDGTTTQTYTVEFTVEPGSNDASLSDIKVGGQSIDGFAASTLSYTISLPFGTLEVPVVTATIKDANASAVINEVASLPGTTNIVVTAEDGTSIQTYTVEFTVEPGSNNANLSDIKVGGQTIDGFATSTLSYTISLPFGTTLVPNITATTTDIAADVLIMDAQSIPGTTKLAVTAEDGTTAQIYFVTFSLESPSTDASLSDLKLDGQTIEGFSPVITRYLIELEFGSIDVPMITATANDVNATVETSFAGFLPGEFEIVVTAQDGITIRNYSINMTVAIVASVEAEELNNIEAYSSNQLLYINTIPEMKFGKIELYNLSGQRILNRTLQQTKEKYVIRESGLALMRIFDKSGELVMTRKLLFD